MHTKSVVKTDYSIDMWCSEFIRKSVPLLAESIVMQEQAVTMQFAGNAYHFHCTDIANIVQFLQRVLKEQLSRFYIILFFDDVQRYISFKLREVKQ